MAEDHEPCIGMVCEPLLFFTLLYNIQLFIRQSQPYPHNNAEQNLGMLEVLHIFTTNPLHTLCKRPQDHGVLLLSVFLKIVIKS